MGDHFNFKQEVLSKYDSEIYDMLCDSFCQMPIAALVDDRILAIHAGISPSIVKDGLQGIENINRFKEVNTDQVFIDLLWSDPADEKKQGTDFTFKPNVQRKCSTTYGKQSINEFLELNDLLCIVRAH